MGVHITGDHSSFSTSKAFFVCLFVCFFFCPLESKFISMTSFDRGFGGLGAKLGILAEGYSDVMKLITKGLA